ncbi:MAG: diphthine synthase, partial [Nanoarchaeota archaeon]|nr:diphthine synthase [Nanoarchaeota archaeon]
AIGETGLQLYKFGKTTTLAYSEDNYKPTSFYETIQQNKKSGLHTLVLLDVKADKNRFMTVKEGLKTILEVEKEKKGKIISEDTKVVAVCQLGGDQRIKYAKVKTLMKENPENTPAVLIITGELHFLEKEYLEGL